MNDERHAPCLAPVRRLKIGAPPCLSLCPSVCDVEIRISLRFDKKYFARYYFRFVIFSLFLISSPKRCLKTKGGQKTG